MEQVEQVEQPVSIDNEADDDDPQDQPAPQTRPTTKVTAAKVFLTRGYWLGKYEVTQAEWAEVLRTKPWENQVIGKKGNDFPATFVSWEQAMKFCQTITSQERQAGRLPDKWEYTLPTEAQWERACRARTETRFSFGDDESNLGEYAWFGSNAVHAGEGFPHRIGQKKANPWGLHDMHGNVWEWCRDSYARQIPGGRDPYVTTDSTFRVYRGGGFGADTVNCRSAVRHRNVPDHRGCDLGFRVALSSVRSDE
jgi:formylglycine-generating enzyme required for sulfatase activity